MGPASVVLMDSPRMELLVAVGLFLGVSAG